MAQHGWFRVAVEYRLNGCIFMKGHTQILQHMLDMDLSHRLLVDEIEVEYKYSMFFHAAA